MLDIGCGCGASAIAAKMAGASSVTANDIDNGKKLYVNSIVENFYH